MRKYQLSLIRAGETSTNTTELRFQKLPGKVVDADMEHRLGRAPVLSPLEESSEEVSRDSGIVSQSTSTVSMLSEGLSNGNVSQSPSFGLNASRSPSFAGNVSESPSFGGDVPQSPDPDGAAAQSPVHEQEDEILRQTALSYSSYIRADAGEEVSKCHPRCCVAPQGSSAPGTVQQEHGGRISSVVVVLVLYQSVVVILWWQYQYSSVSSMIVLVL